MHIIRYDIYDKKTLVDTFYGTQPRKVLNKVAIQYIVKKVYANKPRKNHTAKR